MKRIIVAILLLLSVALPSAAKSVEIHVRSQADFDTLDERLKAYLKQGFDDIKVVFANDTFYFGEKHVALTLLSYPAASVRFEGNGAVLVGKGEDVTLKRKKKGRFAAPCSGYDWRHAVIDMDSLQDVRPLGKFRQAPGPIEIIDAKKGLCRLRADEKAEKNPSQMAVQFSSWYMGYRCPVVKIEGGYIYFTVSNLSYNGEFYNIEGDRRYGKKNPKYQLINSPEADVYYAGGRLRAVRKGRYHICKVSQAFDVQSCNFKLLEIKDLTFLGNTGESTPLIHFFNLPGTVRVTGCKFRGIRTLCISSRHTKDASYTSNVVEGCYQGFIVVDRESIGTKICDNTFRDNQLYLNNTFEVEVRGRDFVVKGNTFEDFTYGAIGIGNHFTSPGNADSSGTVENNEIYYTDAYRKEPTRTLMDSGAIYLWTKQDNVTIRYNYIHDYCGSGDNRGIFGDDGACNVTLYGNKILRIANSYCIDVRRVESVETRSDSHVKKANVGIKMYDNTVDGTVRFEPRPGDKTSRVGVNKTLK